MSDLKGQSGLLDGQTPGTRDVPLYAGLFCLAFVIRFLFLLEIAQTPLFSLFMNDASVYDQWARTIAQGNWLGDKVFYQAPLYPYFVGTVYSWFGTDLFSLRVIQVLMGSFSCVMVAQAGKYFFSQRAGWAAGILLALYPPAIYFDFIIQKAVLSLVFMALLLVCLGRALDNPTRKVWLAAGFTLGCLCLVRENALLIVAIVCLWLVVYYSTTPFKTRAVWCFVFLAGTALALFPVAARNNAVGGQFFLTTSQFGPNLYIGNNLEANGMYMPLVEGRGQTEFEQPDATRLAQEALGQPLTPGEVSRYWTSRAVDYIRSNPVHWVGLMLQKTWLYWNAMELPDTECQYTYARYSFVLNGLGKVFHFGVLFPLAVFGMCSTLGDRKRLGVLYWLGLGLFASTILFYVFARYRYPIVPILMLFAGSGLVDAYGMIREARVKPFMACALPAIITAILVNQPLPHKNQMMSTSFYNIGTALYNQGRDKVSIPYFQEAIALDPQYAFAHYNLGMALESLGKSQEALEHYGHACRINPGADRHRIRFEQLKQKMNSQQGDPL